MVSGETIRRVLLTAACAAALAACGPTAAPRFVAGAPAPSAVPSPSAASPSLSPSASAGSRSAAPRPPVEKETRVLGVQLPPMAPEVEDELVDPSPLVGEAAEPLPLPSRAHQHALIPESGTRTFASATGGTSRVGDGSILVTYKAQIEGGIPGWTPNQFAAIVDTVLGDGRSWRASHKWSFQRVGPDTTPSLYIRLATKDTVDYYCGLHGVDTEGKYSCRFGKYVMINLNRWLRAVPGFGVDIDGYRAMVTNHEVGHFLGYQHQACPVAGQLAPVMQTQTIALNGCLPNSWPYPDGVHFVGGPPAPA